MSHLPPAVPAAPAPTGGSEGCPTPLDWAEVVQTFRERRIERVISTSHGPVMAWEFGQGAPLVCVGGLSGDLELFTLLVWLLREERRCLLLDLHDAEEIRDPAARLQAWGRMVSESIAQTAGSAPVYAPLWGALPAMQAALDAPDRVSRLILQGAPTQVRWSLLERMLLSLGRRSKRRLDQLPLWERITEANHRPWFPPFDAERWGFLRDNLGRTPARRFANRAAALSCGELNSRLPELQCPTLIIRTEGEGSRAAKSQEELAALIPGARMEWMHTTGQYPQVTHPHRLAKLIREFL